MDTVKSSVSKSIEGKSELRLRGQLVIILGDRNWAYT